MGRGVEPGAHPRYSRYCYCSRLPRPAAAAAASPLEAAAASPSGAEAEAEAGVEATPRGVAPRGGSLFL